MERSELEDPFAAGIAEGKRDGIIDGLREVSQLPTTKDRGLAGVGAQATLRNSKLKRETSLGKFSNEDV